MKSFILPQANNAGKAMRHSFCRVGEKECTTTLETKDWTNSSPIWETIKSAKQKVSSRDCCRGLKGCDSGATAVTPQPQPSQQVLSALMSMGISLDGRVSPLLSPVVTFSSCPLFRMMKIWVFSAQCPVQAHSCFSSEVHFAVCHQVSSRPPSKVVVVFQSDSEMVIHTFIMARLDYCNSLLADFPKRALHKLQMVWNVADRIWAKKGQYHPFCQNLYLGDWLDNKLI